MRALTLDLIDFLETEQARQALDALALADLSELGTLQTLAQLRQRFAPAQAAALLDQARLRQRAGDKFPRPETLLFEDEALQQASSRAVAVYRAAQFRRYNRVADLGCGIGADSIALAEAGLAVLAVEIDPIRARLARRNIAALGLAGWVEVLCADWTSLALAGQAAAAFVDPGRREGGRRIFDLDQMTPPPLGHPGAAPTIARCGRQDGARHRRRGYPRRILRGVHLGTGTDEGGAVALRRATLECGPHGHIAARPLATG